MHKTEILSKTNKISGRNFQENYGEFEILMFLDKISSGEKTTSHVSVGYGDSW